MKRFMLYAMLVASPSDEVVNTLHPKIAPDCDNYTREIKHATKECARDESTQGEMGIYQEFTYWDGKQCIKGHRLIRCENTRT